MANERIRCPPRLRRHRSSAGGTAGSRRCNPSRRSGRVFLMAFDAGTGKDEACSRRFRRSSTYRRSSGRRSSAGARLTRWRATSPATMPRSGATASWTDRSPPTTRWASTMRGAARTRTSSSATTPCSASDSDTRTASTARGYGSRSRSRSSSASTTSGRSRSTGSIASSSCARRGSTRSPASRPNRASGSG